MSLLKRNIPLVLYMMVILEDAWLWFIVWTHEEGIPRPGWETVPSWNLFGLSVFA